MTEAEQIAERVRFAMPKLKTGTLRFWGEWFGRPHDNVHQIVACEAGGGILRLQFNDDEVLSVWNATGCIADERAFSISDAKRLRWEWFAYGRPKTPANLYFEDFRRSATGFAVSTNIDWFTPQFRPSSAFPAVEIL